MKKFGILNRKLNDALSSLGHTDIFLITDAGFPLPYDSQPGTISVDLAIAQDLPDIPTVLKLINDEVIYEECYVAEYQQQYNPELYKKVKSLVKRCEIKAITHEELLLAAKKAKVIIRTGSFDPWGNIMLVSGINAPAWFSKPGIATPEFYTSRAKFEDKDYPFPV